MNIFRKITFIAVLLTVMLSGPALAADVLVIAHPSVSTDSLSKAELTRIYQKKMTQWSGGGAIVPVDLGGAGDTQTSFYKSIMGMTVGEISNYWIRQAMTVGVKPPRSFQSPELVVKYVSMTPGAIGYVASGTGLDGVKQITVR